jgi:hypothetical protein
MKDRRSLSVAAQLRHRVAGESAERAKLANTPYRAKAQPAPSFTRRAGLALRSKDTQQHLRSAQRAFELRCPCH